MDKDLLIRTARFQYGSIKAYCEKVGFSKQRFYAVCNYADVSESMKVKLSSPLALTPTEYKKIFDK